MAGKKQKFYVVWEGFEPGVYTSWKECQRQVDGFAFAKYKSFDSIQEAELAYEDDYRNHWGKPKESERLSATELAAYGKPILESISVDGACNMQTGLAEYQGRDTATGALLFHQGPFEGGTNNVVEFLAIVHALALCKKQQWTFPIYSDSRNAMNWVKYKNVRTKLQPTEKNKKLFELIERGVAWLHNNTYVNPILKWETKAWGENPADFGRK